MVDSKNISVVVQGAVDRINTPLCLQSIRKYLPESEIILSTWKGSDVIGLDYDILVENEDPGAFPCDTIENSVPNNINRQIVSTREGLKRSSRKYCVKMRTDFVLTSNNFLSYWEKYNARNVRFSFFREKIIACTIYSRNPRYKINIFKMPFCPSDFFYFGFREDLATLFSIDLAIEDIEKKYFNIYPKKRNKIGWKYALCRYMPEQFIWINFIKKHISINCEHAYHITNKNIELTEITFANNLVLLEKERLGIESLKPDLFIKGGIENCFSFYEWFACYQKYCCNDDRLFTKYLKNIHNRNVLSKRGYQKYKNVFLKKVNNLQYVEKHIADKTVVSFDIFDTLLFRRCEPNIIPNIRTALYIEMLLKSTHRYICESEIYYLRDKLIQINNQENIKKYLDIDFRIMEIIRQLMACYNLDNELTDSHVEKIVENEVLREISCLFPNPEAILVLANLKKSGKKIIAVSDMYLSKTDIEKILRAFGLLDFFDDIFVSSEYKLLKSTGKLFMKVCGELRINKEEIIHIGDNVDSDALAPKRLGIDALWYYNKENLKRRDAVNRWKWGEKEADKYFNDIFKYSINDKTFEHYVRSCFAPDFCNFVYELLLFAYRNNIEIIYFIERDGNLFKNIAEKLVDGLSLFKYMNHIQFKLMKLPRRISSGLTDFSCAANIIHRAYDQNPPPEFSIDHVIGCFNLKYDDFDITEQEDIKKNDANILFFIENYERLFKEKIAKHNKRTGEYIESLGLYNYKKILLCDIGWGGRIQKDITRYLENIKSGIECWGVYYATYDKINEVKNYSYSNGIDLLHGWALLEFLIKEYTHGKDDMHKKILDNKLMEETYILNALSRSVILEYVPEYIRIMEENTLLPYDVKNFLHIRTENMIKNPPKEFCMQLERVHFNYNRKTNEESIPLIPIIKNEKDMERVRQTPQWVEGVEVLSGRCCLRRRNIFWLPRKIHSFFRCWRKNGLIYTIKYLIKKYLRKSGLMRIPRHGGDIHRSGTVEAMLRAARLK